MPPVVAVASSLPPTPGARTSESSLVPSAVPRSLMSPPMPAGPPALVSMSIAAEEVLVIAPAASNVTAWARMLPSSMNAIAADDLSLQSSLVLLGPSIVKLPPVVSSQTIWVVFRSVVIAPSWKLLAELR